MTSQFRIGDRVVAAGNPTYIIAEMSANHGQSLQQARDVILAMKEAGADAVKLQTYTPDTMTIDCDYDRFIVGSGMLWQGRKLYELYQEAYTPWEWHAELFAYAKQLEIDCFSTPFDKSSVDFLELLNPPCYKIASFEVVDIPLIEYIASKGRPIIMSTGMATLAEISDAVAVVEAAGVPLALLKCTSAYPSPPEAMNLNTIPHLTEAFGTPVGLSDHTLGIAVPVAAVAMGAKIIEKHFTLSRDEPGPDSAFSLEPHEFRAMADAIRVAEKSMGRVQYGLTAEEANSRVFRRSLFFVKDVLAGEMLTVDNVRSIRPGHGLAPRHLKEVLGRTAAHDIRRGTPLSWSLIR